MRNTFISADMKRSYFTKNSYVVVDHCLCLPPQSILSLVTHKFRSHVSSQFLQGFICIKKKTAPTKAVSVWQKFASFTRYRQEFTQTEEEGGKLSWSRVRRQVASTKLRSTSLRHFRRRRKIPFSVACAASLPLPPSWVACTLPGELSFCLLKLVFYFCRQVLFPGDSF